MKTIIFHCEVITPMFLAGADGIAAELRPPSIKGALRFWWRACHGHLVNLAEKDETKNYQDLIEKESSLFGGFIGKGQEKSSVIIRVEEEEEEEEESTVSASDFNQTYRIKELKGLSYLYYTIIHYNNTKTGFDVGTKFRIVLQSKNDANLKQAIACFWFLVNLGGLGARARRAAGNFQVVNITDDFDMLQSASNPNKKLSFTPNKVEELKSFFKESIKMIQEFIPEAKILNYDSAPKYSTLSGTFFTSKKHKYKNWYNTVDDIGLLMKNIRDSNSKRRFTIYTLNQKAAFGLPINVRNDHPINLRSNERRASPIFIKVGKCADGDYYWLVHKMLGEFMSDGELFGFVEKSKNKKMNEAKKEKLQKGWSKVDNALLDSFLEKMKFEGTQINYKF